MRIRKVVRRKGDGVVAGVNAVFAANIGETDAKTTASSRQHVEIVQRDGHTEVHEQLPAEDDREA